MEEENQKELQLLPTPHSMPSTSKYRSIKFSEHPFEGAAPSLDLQLSISVRPIHHHQPRESNCKVVARKICEVGGDDGDREGDRRCVEALKWQAAEQIRLAAIEKAYAERVRELTKREMEMAQSEFARARQMWERAREEVDKAERIRERATRQIDSTCLEITCQSCRQRFRP